MNMTWLIGVLAASVLIGPAWAQTATRPLNLKLPPSDIPAASATVVKPASATTLKPASVSSAPGVYYGDTSGRMGHTGHATASTRTCDDSTYNQAQMHGSVGMGVVGGNHMSGSYQTGTVNVTKNLGDCEHPTGAVSFSIGVGTGNFHGRGRGRGW